VSRNCRDRNRSRAGSAPLPRPVSGAQELVPRLPGCALHRARSDACGIRTPGASMADGGALRKEASTLLEPCPLLILDISRSGACTTSCAGGGARAGEGGRWAGGHVRGPMTKRSLFHFPARFSDQVFAPSARKKPRSLRPFFLSRLFKDVNEVFDGLVIVSIELFHGRVSLQRSLANYEVNRHPERGKFLSGSKRVPMRLLRFTCRVRRTSCGLVARVAWAVYSHRRIAAKTCEFRLQAGNIRIRASRLAAHGLGLRSTWMAARRPFRKRPQSPMPFVERRVIVSSAPMPGP